MIDHYDPHIVTAQDYYPFGMLSRVALPNNNKSYQFGFNGQMMNNDVKGGLGNSYTAQFWEYDSRIGRRWNLDPKPIGGISEYSAFGNYPIGLSDPLGDTTGYDFFGKTDKPSFHLAAAHEIQKQVNDKVFVIYAHGSSNVILSYDKKGRKQFITKADQFKKVMDEKTNGNWSKSVAEFKKAGKEVVVMIKACNVASNDFYDEHFGQGEIHMDKTIGQQISKELDVTVIAPDGYGLYSRDPNKPGVIGYHNQDGDAGLLTIKEGKVVAKKANTK